MRLHLPPAFWEKLFKDIEDNELVPDLVRKTLGISPSTFYRKKKEYYNGGVQPRKPGSGRPRIYHTEDYEPMIKEILTKLPPVAGHKRIWMEMRKRGAPFSQGTAYRMMKELNLLVPKKRGRCRKKYKALEPEGPDDIWVADTTTFWMGRQRVEIYLCLDAYSRYIPHIMIAHDRTSRSTVSYYAELFGKRKPRTLHTDNGTEFKNRNALTLLDEIDVKWKHGPSHTPEAQGLVERLVKTLKEEWLMWKEPSDMIELQECIEAFRDWYNRMRDHSALNYKPPEVVYLAKI